MLPEAERYASLALKYLENAAEELSRGELEKASEHMWALLPRLSNAFSRRGRAW